MLLAVNHLKVAINNNTIIDEVGFNLKAGQTMALLGTSGSGKSTLLRALMVAANLKISGSIFFNGQNLLSMSSKQLQAVRGKEIAYLPQQPLAAFNPVLSLGYQLTEAAKLHKLPAAVKEERLNYLLVKAQLPKGVLKKRAEQLSGGMAARLMLVMALLNSPKLLISDELTASLDEATAKQIMQFIKDEQAERAMGHLFVSHNLALTRQFADRVMQLKEGKLNEINKESLVYPINKERQTVQIDSKAKPLLQLTAINKSYGKEQVLNNINLTIYPHETVVLLGKTGSGKSTLARLILGLTKADSGHIVINEKAVIPLALILQESSRAFNPYQNMLFNLSEAALAHKLYSKAELKLKIAELCHQCGLPEELLGRKAYQLSGGERQRMAIIRALLLKAGLIICDEVTSSLDSLSKINIINLLNNLKDSYGLSFLFITHDTESAALMASRLLLLQDGVLTTVESTLVTS
ncbi:MAG: ATP-binding cassette domain-containing protein [Spirochaetaceae bacterium]|nr:ATP-binding cassette domain-containing protein [Spirochaetaceae bacterium]